MASKRKHFSIEEKVRFIRQIEEGRKKCDLCKEINMPTSTLSTIIKNKDRILNAFNKNIKSRKKLRKSTMDDVDYALVNWYEEKRAQKTQVSCLHLQKQATHFARELGYGEDFHCTIRWISRFRERHAINLKTPFKQPQEPPEEKTVEAQDSSSPNNQVTDDWVLSIWPDYKSKYSRRDIFSCDETGLFYKITPDATKLYKNETCNEGAMCEDRVTLLLCTNADGTEKCPILCIGRYENPTCFKNIKKLPVEYKANNKAWITSKIFLDWLFKWDNQLMHENRKILLILDDCPAHVSTNLSNIELLFRPNSPSTLQSVIKNFKTYFRKCLIFDRNKNQNPKPELTLLDAIHSMHKAWMCVTEDTVKNCFQRAGLFTEVRPICTNTLENYLPIIEIKKLGNLSITDAEEYVSVDDNLVTSHPFGVEEDEDNKETICVDLVPTYEEVHESIKKIRNYFEHSSTAVTKLFDAITYIEIALEKDVNQIDMKDCTL